MNTRITALGSAAVLALGAMMQLHAAGTATKSTGATAAPAPGAAAAPPTYAADPAHSSLGFAGTQAGAEFKGVFRKFSARVAFDPARLSASRIEVQIDTGSEDTQDGERDATLRSADFFDVAHHAQATYVTRTITQTAGGFSAVGTLTLRGVSRDVPISFTFRSAAGGAALAGSAAIKRLDFGVGQGEWKSTEWVGNDVRINFTLDLKPAP